MSSGIYSTYTSHTSKTAHSSKSSKTGKHSFKTNTIMISVCALKKCNYDYSSCLQNWMVKKVVEVVIANLCVQVIAMVVVIVIQLVEEAITGHPFRLNHQDHQDHQDHLDHQDQCLALPTLLAIQLQDWITFASSLDLITFAVIKIIVFSIPNHLLE